MLKELWIRVRWLRQRLSPWAVIVLSLCQFLLSCGVDRTQAHIRLMAAISRLNAAQLIASLNDLLI